MSKINDNMIKVLKTKRVLEKGTLIAKQVMLLTSKLETGELKQLESNSEYKSRSSKF